MEFIELLQGHSIGGKTQEKKQTCAKLGCLSWACYCNHDICQLWWRRLFLFCPVSTYVLDAATSSGIMKAKQKLGVTFNSHKLGGIDFTKFSKLSKCSAGAGRCWLVQWPGLPARHCTWSVLKFL